MFASSSFPSADQGSFKEVAYQAASRLRAARALRADRARIRSELDQCSDRDLADLGLSRSDIDSVVAGVRARAA